MSARALAGLRITKLERDPSGGYWTARATLGGETVRVDRRYGSWRVVEFVRGREVARRDAAPALAAALQNKVTPLERKERTAREHG